MALFLENDGLHEASSAQTPPPLPHQSHDDGMCGLSKVLVCVGILAIVLGCVCAAAFTDDYSGYRIETNGALVVMYLAGGFISGIFSFAMAIIVDACQKYRMKH